MSYFTTNLIATGASAAWGATTGATPFTVQSCDNLQSNGDVAKRMLVSFAYLQDPLSELLLSKLNYADKDPTPFLNLCALFGEELPRSSAFVDAVRNALESLYDSGARRTLERYCKA